MRKFLFLISLLTFSAIFTLAQAGRIKPIAAPTSPSKTVSENVSNKTEVSAEKMYQEANLYTKNKVAEFEKKKIPYSDALYRQTVREQKQLAAKYAATISTRQNLSGEDFYFLGMLHWLANNADGTSENLKKFLTSENVVIEKAQTARSVLAVIAARQKNFEEAETLLAEYLKTNPIRQIELGKIESELARGYQEEKNYAKAIPHAEQAYRIAKENFRNNSSRVRALAELLDSGVTIFEIYRDSENQKQAETALEDLRKAAALVESVGIYYYAVDTHIKYMIETGHKSEALAFYADSLNQVEKDFAVKPLKDDVVRRLKGRGKQYRLLGEPAPELASVDRTTAAEPKTLAGLRGKVILLDFWATWCAPCLDAFPSLIQWHQTFQKDGLEVLGLTRYYGQAEGSDVDAQKEFEFLQRFKKTNNLTYDLAVAKDSSNQIAYEAKSIPTTVLIDRKGIIRYIETGAGREEEIQAMIEKLLAEK